MGSGASISDEVIVVGASADDDAAPNAGAAYVFRYDGNAWNEEAKLFASDANDEDKFGISVSTSGSDIVVGATGDDSNGLGAGAAYVFRFNGSTWGQIAKLRASDAFHLDAFGNSVSISGKVIVVGAMNGGRVPGWPIVEGAAYVFRRTDGHWAEEARLFPEEAGSIPTGGAFPCSCLKCLRILRRT